MRSPAAKLLHRVRWFRASRLSTAAFAGICDQDRQIIEACAPYTMTSVRRLHSLIEAVRYLTRADIPGAFAECGVWRGGSVLAMIKALQAAGVNDREIYLFDTFEGMTKPTDHDTSQFHGGRALDAWSAAEHRGERVWAEEFGEDSFSLESVQDVLFATGYPPDLLHFIQGTVEVTLPDRAPDSLALLRLDTDWYESTLHELRHLYPGLVRQGVLIVDDYGHWDGCRLAVDEYFADRGPLLTPIDYSGRLAIKP